MAKIKLAGKRERLIHGKWIIPGEVLTVSDKALPALVERLGGEIEVLDGVTAPAQRKTRGKKSEE